MSNETNYYENVGDELSKYRHLMRFGRAVFPDDIEGKDPFSEDHDMKQYEKLEGIKNGTIKRTK